MDEYIEAVIGSRVFRPKYPVLPRYISRLYPDDSNKKQRDILADFFANSFSTEAFELIVTKIHRRKFDKLKFTFDKIRATDKKLIVLRHFFPDSIGYYLRNPDDFEMCKNVCNIYGGHFAYVVAVINYLSYSNDARIIEMAKKLTDSINSENMRWWRHYNSTDPFKSVLFPERTRFERRIFWKKSSLFVMDNDKPRYISFDNHVMNIICGDYDPYKENRAEKPKRADKFAKTRGKK